MHHSVCFEASRLTLTQSSWTTPRPGCARQWMSGYAAVPLAAPSNRGPRIIFNFAALGEPAPSSEGESPFPLDLYLSWMSPVFNFESALRPLLLFFRPFGRSQTPQGRSLMRQPARFVGASQSVKPKKRCNAPHGPYGDKELPKPTEPDGS